MNLYRELKRKLRIPLLCVLVCLLFSFPAYAARYTDPYPTAENKKGIALGWDMEEDSIELNVCHATFNFSLSQIFAFENEKNSRSSYAYTYKGKKYWFRKPNINSYDRILKKLKKNNTIVTGILLMEKRRDLKRLICSSGRSQKAYFYAWNMDNGTNQRQIEAAISFLANRYNGGKHGNVVGWIVGNEIDSPDDWNEAGKISFSEYMDLYCRMFEVSSKIVRKAYTNARLYIPLDHFWNMINSNKYTARACLEAFAARMKKDGYAWNLAYHAYNGDLMQPSITDPQYFETTQDIDSPIITMKNLNVLSDYIRTNYGEKTRIMLSEHGYSSTWKHKKVSAQQCLAIALSYYLTQLDPMVDSFIYYSQVDQNDLKKVGATFGIWNVSKHENATSKKQSWSIFKYMDTDLDDPILKEARNTAEKMTGRKVEPTRKIRRTTLKIRGKYGLKKKLTKGWKACGAVSSVRRKGSRYTLRRDTSRNKNVYWGLQQNFKKLNVSSSPHLVLTVRKGRLTTGRTQLLIRVFSGKKSVFETYADIRSKKTQRLQADLSGWQGRKAITRIEILVKRESGKWKSRSGAVVEKIGFF